MNDSEINERRAKLEEIAMQEQLAFKKLKPKKKKTSWQRRLTSYLAVLVAGIGFHIVNPVWPHTLKYLITDKFTETAQEKKLEEKFNISYFGTKDFKKLEYLEANLNIIKKENPALIKHLNTIILYDQKDLEKPYTSTFLFFGGRAIPVIDCIELCNSSYDTIVHELAHIMDFNTSKEFDKKLAKIHKDSIGKDFKKEWRWYKLILPSKWKDGERNPRHGQVEPYGANHLGETLATYLELGNHPYELNGVIEDPTKYFQTIDLLEEYKFLTQTQAQQFRTRIKANCPTYVRKLVLEEIAKLTPPKFIKEESSYGVNSETYYESENLTITYYAGMHGCSISISFKMEGNDSIEFSIMKNWTNGQIKLYPGDFGDNLNDYFPPEAYERFKELGYENLLDWQEKQKIKEGTKLFEGTQ